AASTPAAAAPRVAKLQPRRRGRIRLAYILQAWSFSLVVHAAILSVLAFATFSSADAVKGIINFDSALAGHGNGERAALPIYADPDNIERNKAIGDENASNPGEPTMVCVGDEGGDGEDGGGVVVAGGLGIGRPSATPRVRGAGKGKINEGSS